jgi:hypothetical protein
MTGAIHERRQAGVDDPPELPFVGAIAACGNGRINVWTQLARGSVSK